MIILSSCCGVCISISIQGQQVLIQTGPEHRACLPELSVCALCHLHQMLVSCRTAEKEEGAKVLQEAAGGWALSDKAILWAKSTVWSRAFNIPYLGNAT